MRFSRLAVLFIATFLITDRGSAQAPMRTKAQLQAQVDDSRSAMGARPPAAKPVSAATGGSGVLADHVKNLGPI
jgi:hypothetical protein